MQEKAAKSKIKATAWLISEGIWSGRRRSELKAKVGLLLKLLGTGAPSRTLRGDLFCRVPAFFYVFLLANMFPKRLTNQT